MQPKKRKFQSSLPTLLTSQTEIAEAGEKLRQEELLGSGAFAAVYLCSLDGQPRAKKVVSDTDTYIFIYIYTYIYIYLFIYIYMYMNTHTICTTVNPLKYGNFTNWDTSIGGTFSFQHR